MSDAALAAAVDAARAAGRVALKYYHGGFEIVLKPDATPVTQADREAERTIVEILGRTFPEHGFLGEEFGSSGKADTRWIIDPIDGTKNFVRHIPIWATLIALEEHGEITVGVIHNPVTGDLYTARRGGGRVPERRAHPHLGRRRHEPGSIFCTPGCAARGRRGTGTGSCGSWTRPTGSAASATTSATA